MNQPLGYLKEVLSNYTDRSDVCQEIYSIIREHDFTTEESFVRKLSNEQIDFLNKILPDEIDHAREVEDSERVEQLNEVFELLY
ncbi:sigma-G-dependent sporulation-specific acid-soluble spore protein CsgA [Robertmurraya massiliosenegalensis]|uniref:sigma-G-dependent sporulation-specific acid-soluble spore protein CsgA n=1 Tax=Robertmurraya massiliosenegalensis TaxID=1287657 RepID=UPI0003730CD6|nr:sigma-G-dependent sporulation-specific acid-soluble spore protein CsgA [Robertmurraya massiliosenegalensis]